MDCLGNIVANSASMMDFREKTLGCLGSTLAKTGNNGVSSSDSMKIVGSRGNTWGSWGNILVKMVNRWDLKGCILVKMVNRWVSLGSRREKRGYSLARKVNRKDSKVSSWES